MNIGFRCDEKGEPHFMARMKLGQHFILRRAVDNVSFHTDKEQFRKIKFLPYYMYDPIQEQTQT